jgi:hypothetical protein
LITHFGTVTLVIKASTHISATTLARMDEGRKRVLLIAAAILAARKLVNWDGDLPRRWSAPSRIQSRSPSGSWRGLIAGGRHWQTSEGLIL